MYFGLIFLQPGSALQGRIFLSISNCRRSKFAHFERRYPCLMRAANFWYAKSLKDNSGGREGKKVPYHGFSCWAYKEDGIYLIAYKSWSARAGHQCKSFTYRGSLHLPMGCKSVVPVENYTFGDPSLCMGTCTMINEDL